MTRDQLYRRLDERLASPARADEVDRAIWSEVGRERAILVSDMTGFTRLTRARGILDFLAMFRRAVALATPLFERHGATLWKTSADNLMASFASAADALAVARQLATLDLAPSRLCLGLGWGRVLELEDDIFGDEVNLAYKLGEDVAGPGEVLLSEATARQITDVAFEGPLRIEVGGVEVPYFRVR